MRVLLISHTCQSPAEGQPKAVELARLAGVELKVVVPDRWKHYGRWRPLEILPEAGGVIEPLAVCWPWVGPAQFYLHWYPKLAKVVRAFKPDVIDVWEEPWGLVSLQAARARRRWAPRAKLVLETEQNLNKQLPMPFEWIRRKSLGQADWLVARNAEAVGVCRSKGYTGPATVLPNAVDVGLFAPMDRAACRQAVKVEGPTLAYIGRLVPEKGLGDLLDAFARLKQDCRLLLVGEGPMDLALRQKSVDLGISDRIEFRGKMPLDQLPQVMNAIDALVLPSRTTERWKEQFGRVIIEAFACGTAVIGSDSGAIPEVIAGDGWVYPEGDVAALAEAIESCLAVSEEDRLAKAASRRERVLAEFSWGRVAERYVEVYRQALGQSGDASLADESAQSPALAVDGGAA